MVRMATDVVLLPGKTLEDRMIEVSRQIAREYSSEIVLNRTDCLPHLSLAMGCIEEQDVGAIHKTLERLAEEIPAGQLTATGIQTSTNSRGQTISLLEIEKTPELQAFHEQVMEAMKGFFRYDVAEAVFYDDVVADTTQDWVRNYKQQAAYEQFNPHITLGYGRAKPEFSFPVAFSAARLALCHLGNHGTCRKILAAAGNR